MILINRDLHLKVDPIHPGVELQILEQVEKYLQNKFSSPTLKVSYVEHKEKPPDQFGMRVFYIRRAFTNKDK